MVETGFHKILLILYQKKCDGVFLLFLYYIYGQQAKIVSEAERDKFQFMQYKHFLSCTEYYYNT